MKTLSQILTQEFNVSDKDIKEANLAKAEMQLDLTGVLVKKKIISENQRLSLLSSFYDIPFEKGHLPKNAASDFTKKVSIQFLKTHLIFPIITKNEHAENLNQIVICNPSNFQATDNLAAILDIDSYSLLLAKNDEIISAINTAYDQSRDSAEELMQNIEENGISIIDDIENTADLLDDSSDAPIIKLVNHILSQSIKARASDIHIEPYQDVLNIRYRIDGTLYDLLTPPKWMQAPLTSRIKVMAKLDIAEKRLPQDGRIDIKIGDQEIDIRVSTIPTSFGERVVLRLLNKSMSLLKLTQLGLSENNNNIVSELIRLPNGIILITGPTGSGKTTSLYAILSSINNPDINIITIEDPVEYQLKGISQIHVNTKIDLTFAKGLRAIVRQDPDVILIGEIRDKETSEIAVQSALTGHLVFSTLHTNDSASSITRLVDLGIEPFLISSALKAIIAQRLVRILCNSCKEAYIPDKETLESLKIEPERIQDKKLYKAKGCVKCFHTGYKGRISIFEILVLEKKIKKLILSSFDSNKIKQEAIALGMKTLREDGTDKVIAGITSIAEILRVTAK